MDLAYLIHSALRIPDYWHPYLEIQTDFLSGKIGRYPVSMDVKADYPGALNDEGVPIVFLNGESCVLPVTVALYGLGNHDAFLASGKERYSRQMMHALRWFENHPIPLGDGIGWANREDLPIYGLKTPWFSGLVQGFALSLFLRAHQLDQAGHWSELARKTWLGFHVPVEQGGFRRSIAGGVIWEEYPGPALDCAFSGMCHVLVGLWEGWRSGIIPEAEGDFYAGAAGLRSCLPKFVCDRWSLYSLNRCVGKPLLASPYYQRSNALMAQIVGLMAEDSEFCTYGKLWEQSSKSLTRRIAMSVRIALDRYLHAPDLLHSDKARKR